MIVDLIGGLGNQMFQYAFGISVAKARNIPVYFSDRLFGKRSNHIRYMMDVYQDLKLVHVSSELPKFQEPSPRFCSDVYNVSPAAVLTGYWQTEKYFDQRLVRKQLILPRGFAGSKNLYLGDWMSNVDSTFIQVRRGDYLNPGTREYHGLQPLDYYLDAASYVKARKPDTHFFVFSDDPQWCEANFPPGFTVINENSWQDRTAQWDIWLMSHCRNGIIANSSFGWWGAWLGDFQPNRIIVAPKKWFDKAGVDESDIVPDRWWRL